MSADISCVKLNNGESVALGGVEITSIPHISIIDEAAGLEDILARYMSELQQLLNEIHQAYMNMSYAAGKSKDLSIELLWKTQKVENQTFQASVRLFILVRAIEREDSKAVEAVRTLQKLISSTLSIQKYDTEFVDYNALVPVVETINDSHIQAIVKEETLENLQNQMLPFCYSYGRLPVTNGDISKVANVLTEYPDCAISIQLIPTVFDQEQMQTVDMLAQQLDMLSKGVSDQNIGTVSFTMAEKHAASYRYYAENKSGPLYKYNILVYGDQAGCNGIATHLFGRLTNGEGGTANLKFVELSSNEVMKDSNFFPLPWAVNEKLMNKARNQQIWASGNFPAAFFRMPYIITAEEANQLFIIPVGSDRISGGYEVNEAGKANKTYATNLINGGDITVGKLKASAHGDTIGFSLKDLAKHMLVVGTPGCGKTTFSVSLLDRLWKEHHIPFLVIEPAKNEYRSLVQSIPELQVFTPGKNFISPFVFNPFIPPKNVKLETYKSVLKTAFTAAVSMQTPLDKIFEETIDNCYSDFRWLDTYTVDDEGKPFNIADFIKCFEETFNEIGYTGDAKNIGRAGIVRLSGLAKLFDNYFSIPIEDLLSKPTIIELAAIENSDEKALIISLVLLSILSYVNANYVGEGGLKNVILLEEAHVLLDADSNAAQGEANPSKIAQGLVKRMLAEIRSYGVGLVIADQSPRKVSTDVVALTDMKMVFRLVENEDKQIIADSTNMSPVQMQRLAKLRPGEAFLFFNKLDEAEEVITPDYRLENHISISLSDESIRSLSTYWQTRADKLRPYPECQMCRHCQESCDYERRVLAREVARRIFKKFFKPDSTDFGIVVKVLGQITNLTKAELNSEPLTPELVSCVKVHLWRKIRYGTKIKVKDVQIENSVRK